MGLYPDKIAFFQAVSNSSWANVDHLLATDINEDKLRGPEKELQILSALRDLA